MSRNQIYPCILMLSLAMLVLSSCKTKAPAAEATVLNPEEQTEQFTKPVDALLTIKMERYACFGKCPVYTLSIYENGIVWYEGRQNVEKIGVWSALIPQDKITALREKGLSIEFFDLLETYPSGDISIADLPATRITFSDGERAHTVLNRNYANPERDEEVNELKQLIEFETLADNLVEDLQFTRVEDSGGLD